VGMNFITCFFQFICKLKEAVENFYLYLSKLEAEIFRIMTRLFYMLMEHKSSCKPVIY